MRNVAARLYHHPGTDLVNPSVLGANVTVRRFWRLLVPFALIGSRDALPRVRSLRLRPPIQPSARSSNDVGLTRAAIANAHAAPGRPLRRDGAALTACEAERLTTRGIAGTQSELPDHNAVISNKVLFLTHP